MRQLFFTLHDAVTTSCHMSKSKDLFSSCHSPLHKRKCHRSQTRADSGSLPEPSRETCPLRTCVSCGSGTWRPQNHRSGKTEISKYINPSLSMVIFANIADAFTQCENHLVGLFFSNCHSQMQRAHPPPAPSLSLVQH